MSQEEGQVLYLSRTGAASLGITTADTVSQIEHLCRERDAGRLLNAPKSLPRPVEDILFMSTLVVSDHRSCISIKAPCKKAEALGLTARDHTVPRQAIEGVDIVVAGPSAENLD